MKADHLTIKKILTRWGLQDAGIKQIYDTAWQVGEDYVLKVYQNRDMLERNLRFLCRLDEMGIPVGKVVLTKAGDSYLSDGDREDVFYFLSQKLPGSKSDVIPGMALQMGEVIGDLHIAFLECEEIEGIRNNSLLEEMKGWVRTSFENCGWKYISREKYDSTIAQLEAVYDRLPMQLIHRDIHFGNFLFDNGRFSGYIDFDLSQRNIRIFDLCYFLLGLLSEEERLDLSEEQWYVLAENTLAGYERKQRLSQEEKLSIPWVMECIELLFTAYFEGTGDLACAEDAFRIYEFVRKRERRIRELAGCKGQNTPEDT